MLFSHGMTLYCHHYYYSNRVENMIKVTDCNELENLAEFYVSSGAQHLVAMKISGQSNSILVGCRFKNEKSFSDSNVESKLFYLLSKLFRSNDHFSKKTLGRMNFRSNELSVKWLFGLMTIFRKKTFGHMNFRSNYLSVICHFGLLTSFFS
jgi:hypothetical protein